MLRRLAPFALLFVALTACALPIPAASPTATTIAEEVVTLTPTPVSATATPTDEPTEPPTDEPTEVVAETPTEIASETPTEAEAETVTATATDTVTEAETPTAMATVTPTEIEEPNTGGGGVPLGDGTAVENDVIYLLDGQLLASALGGPPPRRLYDLPEDAGPIREFTLSPNGETVAFVVNDQELVLLDLTTGEARTIVDRNSTTTSPLLWDPASSKLYFQRIVANANAGSPPILQLWETTQTGAPALILAEEFIPNDSLTPVYALGNDQIAVRFGNETDGEILILDTFTGNLVPLGEDLGIWDVFSDGTLALLFDRQSLGTGTEPLILGDFSISNGATNTQIVEGTDGGGIYRDAKFAPSQFVIAALEELEAGDTSLVTLTPQSDGSITATEYDSAPDLIDVSFTWLATEDAILVERQSADGETFSLWIIDLAGGAEIELTEGRQPAIVGGS